MCLANHLYRSLSGRGNESLRPIRQSISFKAFLAKHFLRGAPSLAIGSASLAPAGDWPRGGVVTQRTANPCTPVRFRARPPPPKIFRDYPGGVIGASGVC